MNTTLPVSQVYRLRLRAWPEGAAQNGLLSLPERYLQLEGCLACDIAREGRGDWWRMDLRWDSLESSHHSVSPLRVCPLSEFIAQGLVREIQAEADEDIDRQNAS